MEPVMFLKDAIDIECARAYASFFGRLMGGVMASIGWVWLKIMTNCRV